MPSSKLLKERIESIQDTMKITNAMYLISSSKLRKAFGSLTYQDMEDFDFVYCAVGFEDSIRRSV